MSRNIAFIDLAAQRARIGERIDAAVARVLASTQFIMGPAVFELERQLAAFCGARHAISCASGTDALAMVLMALDVRPGDAILCPSFTFAATAEVVAWLGAKPVFIDIEPDSFNIDPNGIAKGVATARRLGLRPIGLIPVDLFGRPVNYEAVLANAEKEGLWVLSDAAQSFGARYRGQRVGTYGIATATSFFPAKPLGCYGDGGAIFTDNDDLAARLRSIRIHGQGEDKYDNVRIGMTGRMDTIQAAVLIEKLSIFQDEIDARDRIARRYNERLRDVVKVPLADEEHASTWAQYTIEVPPQQRNSLVEGLRAEGIPTAIYYRKALHQQSAYRHYPSADGGLAATEHAADRVLSLPMHPYLDEQTQDRILVTLRSILTAAAP